MNKFFFRLFPKVKMSVILSIAVCCLDKIHSLLYNLLFVSYIKSALTGQRVSFSISGEDGKYGQQSCLCLTNFSQGLLNLLQHPMKNSILTPINRCDFVYSSFVSSHTYDYT